MALIPKMLRRRSRKFFKEYSQSRAFERGSSRPSWRLWKGATVPSCYLPAEARASSIRWPVSASLAGRLSLIL